MPNDQERKGKREPPPSPCAPMPAGSGATLYEPAGLEEAPVAPVPRQLSIRQVQRPPQPPPLSNALSSVHTVTFHAPEVMVVLPGLCPPCREVELLPKEKMGTVGDFPWVATKRPLGCPVAVNGSLMAVFAAARVIWISTNDKTGATQIGIELVFVSLGSEELQRDWSKKYNSRSAALRRDLLTAIIQILERVELSVALVVRFVGGPPMDQASAQANGYHFWLNSVRCPTRVELDRAPARERARQVREMRKTLDRFGFLALAWWWVFNPAKYDLSQEKTLVPSVAEKIDLRAHQETLAHAASVAGRVIASLGSIVYARDPAAQEALAAKGRDEMEGTQLGGTIMVYPAEPESDDEEDGA